MKNLGLIVIFCFAIILCIAYKGDFSADLKETWESYRSDLYDKIGVHVPIGIYYYLWYDEGLGNRHWNDSSSGIVVDEPTYHSYYSSKNLTHVIKHIKLIKEAGIDFVILSWWGNNSYEDDSAKIFIQADMSQGMPLKFCFIVEPYTESVNHSFVRDYIYSSYVEPYSKYYFKWQGKYLLCWFNPLNPEKNDSRFIDKVIGHSEYVDWYLWTANGYPNWIKSNDPIIQKDGQVSVFPRYDDYYMCASDGESKDGDFEESSYLLDGWNGTTQSNNGVIMLINDRVHHGNQSSKSIWNASGDTCYAYKDIGNNNTLFLFLVIQTDNLPIASGTRQMFIQIRDADNNRVILQVSILKSAAGIISWQIIYRNAGSTTTITTTTSPPTADAYRIVQVKVDCSTSDNVTDGSYGLWIDGNPIWNVSNIDTDSITVDTIRVGLVSTTDAQNNALWVDCVAVASEYIASDPFTTEGSSSYMRYDENLTEGLYDSQWQYLMNHAKQVRLITIYSFNEYHERSQIEPNKDHSGLVNDFHNYIKTVSYIAEFDSLMLKDKTIVITVTVIILFVVAAVIIKKRL